MTARTAWKGTLEFDRVLVPVKLHALATERRDTAIHQVTAEGTRIRQLRVREGTRDEVPWDDVRKGAELANHQIVVLDDADFDDTLPANDKKITIVAPVRLDGVPDGDGRHYWMHPDTDGAKGYAAVHGALDRAGEALVVRLAFGARERLAVIRPGNDKRLYLTTVPFYEDLRQPDKDVPEAAVTAEEAHFADLALAGMAREFSWAAVADESRAALDALVARTINRKNAERPALAPSVTPGDLMAQLKASVEAHKLAAAA